MFCFYCGNKIDEDSAFCTGCGKNLKDAPYKSEIKFCSNCGCQLDEEAVFCTSCGNKIFGDKNEVSEKPIVELENTIQKKLQDKGVKKEESDKNVSCEKVSNVDATSEVNQISAESTVISHKKNIKIVIAIIFSIFILSVIGTFIAKEPLSVFFLNKALNALDDDNNDKVLKNARLSSMFGNDLGYELVGMCYRWGKGTEQDINKAIFFYKKAASKGLESAIKDLVELDVPVDNYIPENNLIVLSDAFTSGIIHFYERKYNDIEGNEFKTKCFKITGEDLKKILELTDFSIIFDGKKFNVSFYDNFSLKYMNNAGNKELVAELEQYEGMIEEYPYFGVWITNKEKEMSKFYMDVSYKK